MADEVIPFGKYKGQAIAQVVQDRNYTEWLTAQSWFKERYANLYTVIVNTAGEPAETPEHNRLQARFLDPDFRARFMSLVCKQPIEKASNRIFRLFSWTR